MLRWVESLSWRSRYFLTGDKRSWCAHAWNNQNRLQWRVHVLIWDRVFLTFRNEPDHCRRAAEWWQ